jgi:hypothetical protein
VPLSKIQSDILRLLSSHRNPESYVAGSTPHIDVFHDRADRVSVAALEDSSALTNAGFQVAWLRQLPLILSAGVSLGDACTKLEWVVDSDFRFFPTIPDETFGYMLHPVDLAANKAMAAAGRRELRDIVDVVTVHETILPLGAVIWAAVEKSPGSTPEGLIAEIRRNSNYPAAEWRELSSSEPIDPKDILSRLRGALDEAEQFVLATPTARIGLLFLKDGQVVQPDPARLDEYQTHAGQRRGQCPSSPEITAAMLERYKSPTQ